MYCANEMVNDYAKAVFEEEQRRIEMETRLAALMALRLKKTIEFCDNEISNRLKKAAEDRKNKIELYVSSEYCWNETDDTFGELFLSEDKYADGTLSYEYKERCYSMAAFIEYLNNHCYNVKTEKYFYKRYGWGTQHGCKITIIPNPQC